jgi:MFS family permease
LPLAANLTLKATASQMGLLAALSFAPVLLIGLLAGVWVDRVRRRPVMIVADLVRALLLVSIPLAAVLGTLHIEQLYIVAALVGMLTVFYEVANQSFLPTLVQREHVVEGNSKLSASGSLAEIGGPTLAGVLVQVMTAPIAILFDVVSFLVSALCTSFIRVKEPAPASRVEGQSTFQEMRDGLRLVLGNPLLRAVAVSSAMRNFSGGAFAALYGLYVIRTLGVIPALFGVLVTAGGAGALLGALFAGRVLRRFGTGKTLIGALLISAITSLSTPLAAGAHVVVVIILLLAQFVGDFGLEIYFINEVSLLQTIIPDEYLGRASASMSFLVNGMVPIGAILAGFLGASWGLRPTLLMGAIGMCLSAVWLICSPLRRFGRNQTI